MCRVSITRCALVFALCALVGWSSIAAAQSSGEYKIGPGDMLRVSVWRHPELDGTFVVRSNGTVTVPPVGEIMAQGLRPFDLARELMVRLRDFTRETTQVTVSVEQFNSRAVFLTGQIMSPGRYSFERIPDILQLLSQAGGPLPSADLSNVSIIRSTARGPEVIPVNLAAYMRGERQEALPDLQPGDTIEFPGMIGASAVAGPGLVYVLGEVNAPGAYPSSEGIDLLQAIALAGGTTPAARLKDVAVVMDGGGGQIVASIDLEKIVHDGAAKTFYLAPGDRVVVPSRETSLAATILGGAGSVLTATRDVLQSYLLYLTVDRTLDEEN